MRKIIIPKKKKNLHIIRKTKIRLLCVGDIIVCKSLWLKLYEEIIRINKNNIILNRYQCFPREISKKRIKINSENELYYVYNDKNELYYIYNDKNSKNIKEKKR